MTTTQTTDTKPAKRSLPPMRSSLATHIEVAAMLRALRQQDGLTVQSDLDDGTATAFVTARPSVVVFAAIQKFRNGPWIVRQMEGLLSRV